MFSRVQRPSAHLRVRCVPCISLVLELSMSSSCVVCGRTDRGSILLFEVPSYSLTKVVVLSPELDDVCKVGMSPSGRFIAGCLAKSGLTVMHNLDLDREIYRHDAHHVSWSAL